jgi:hypothetical protein
VPSHHSQNAIFRIDGVGNYSPIPPILCIKSPIACDLMHVCYKMFVLFFFDKLATEKIGYKLSASVQVV